MKNVVPHPVRALRDVCGTGPVFALVVLFGLNAVDELDRTAFGILLPEIRKEFRLGVQGMLTIVALVSVGALALQVPIAYLADRTSRVRLAVAGAAMWGLFSVGTGLAGGVVVLCIMRSGSGIGKAVVDPTHFSLIADYYEPDHRPRVYSVHRAANAVGSFVGPLTAGVLAHAYGWRVPFILFALPTFVFVVLGLRLREPVRGAQERRAMGSSVDVIATEEEAPSFAESWRMVWKIESLRRIWYALPFLAASLIGFVSLAALLYAQVFHLDERARGFVAAASEPAQLIGLIIGARIATKLLARDPGDILRFLSTVAFVVSALSAAFALAPNIGVAIAVNCLISASLAILAPGILASLSLAIPARARSMGFSVASLWVIPGLVVLPLIGWIADHWGIRQGMLVMVPVFLIGGLVISGAGNLLAGDIRDVWTAAAARSEVLYERRQGRAKLLLVRQLNVAYSGVQVLFDVDLEVDEGDIVALLGTNGAGKSTLLMAISGVVQADRGAVIFDGRDITHAPANEVAYRGVVQMPGGKGVFASLTVGENLDLAGWTQRRSKTEVASVRAEILKRFPVLGLRLGEPAANLSGGQQQMLALSMAFIARPRLLMIDELSLGLAPRVIEELLLVVRALAREGTTVIVVDQSVNVALRLADTAYFMEKGRIRFHGATADLLERPDLLRSVFLEREDAPSPSRPASVGEGVRSPVLEVCNLTRTFGGIRALDDVSLSVDTREIVGVIGPNGAGKTTLFDVIAGFTPPDAGRVRLAGVDVDALHPPARARRGLGRSFQDARLFPALTVTESLAVACERWIEVRSVAAAALYLPVSFDAEEKVVARVDELLELMGLGPFRDKFVRELSTGTRRIVDLACLVAHRPLVVLLDEPSSGIAQKETEALAPLLVRLRDDMGASLIVVEHDLGLVTSIADRLVALDEGRVLSTGSPAAVLADPLVIASYLGPTALGKEEHDGTQR